MLLNNIILGWAMLLSLSACSYQWCATIELTPAEPAPAIALSARLVNSLGDQFSTGLAAKCTQVTIRQHPKLPNKVEITIVDANGHWMGGVTTHDLANRQIVIPLKEINRVALVTPGGKCS
ncbi:hypothetical protein AAKU55_000851 [Oxalobacteraceae bacterium GrIS 1.11]